MDQPKQLFFFNLFKIFSFIFLFFTDVFSEIKTSSYKSQFGQDKYVNEHFFKNKRDGIFVEIGAFDGISLSNTYFFEKELGWQGICVEPVQQKFNLLQKNRSCICIQGCISNFDGKALFAEVSGIEVLSGLSMKYDPRHVHRIQSEGGKIKYYEVDCFTPKTIFEKFNMSHIDFLSIDTEGGEFDILSSINLKSIDIDVITVEVNYPDDKRIHDYLTSHGYQFVQQLGCDELYKKIT
jgi:FkbM family methyltransferase